MNDQPRVCVVGSINMDMVTTTRQMPEQGETVMGERFATYPGGKGANQAVAAARLGAEVSMIGAVGEDPHGQALLAHFAGENIEPDTIQTIPEASTGIATIIVSDNDNRIIVTPGANDALTPKSVDIVRERVLASDVVLLQLEIPMKTIVYTVELAAEHNIPVIINPAPYRTIPEETLKRAAYITPNENELAHMAASAIYNDIKDKIIVTRGAEGVAFTHADGTSQAVPSYPVTVRDTTGAGDTFNGALAAEIAAKHPLVEAVNFANTAGALSVERIGAQGGMPSRKAVNAFMQRQGR